MATAKCTFVGQGNKYVTFYLINVTGKLKSEFQRWGKLHFQTPIILILILIENLLRTDIGMEQMCTDAHEAHSKLIIQY